MATPEEKEKAKSWMIWVLSGTIIFLVVALIIRECFMNKPDAEKYEIIEAERNYWMNRADSFAAVASTKQAEIIAERDQFEIDKNKIRNAQKKFETMGLDSNVVFFLSWTNQSPTE